MSPQRMTWREPSAEIPLRWGTWRARRWGGFALIVGGGVALAGADTWQLLILLAGTAAHVAGWAILPSAGWRRLVVAFPSTLCCWMLLAPPRFFGVLVVPYLCWLIVRHRPPITLLTVLFPITGAMIVGRLFPGFEGRLAALGILLAVMIVSAWTAWALARAQARARLSPSDSTASPA